MAIQGSGSFKIVGKLPEVIKHVKDDNGSMLSNVDITKEDINKRLKNL
jgi:hypothetical protein